MKTLGLIGLIVIAAGCGKAPPDPALSKKPIPLAPDGKVLQGKDSGAPAEAAAGAGRWILQASGVTDDLRDVHFLDARLGFAVGHGNTILRTTDGGQSWKRLLPPEAVELRQVFFVSPKEGWVCSSLVGSILHTLDGGDTWTVVKLPGPGGVYSPRGSNFGSQSAFGKRYWLLYWGFAGTVLQYTDDAGKEWHELKLPFAFPSAASAELSFADLDHGCISWKGGTTEAQGAFTHDGGKTWELAKFDKTLAAGNYMMVRTAGARNAFAAPHVGAMHATTDGGKTWIPQPGQRGGSPNDLHFADSRLGHVLLADPKPEVRRTTDGGGTWSSLGKLQNPAYVHGVCFPDRSHGWVVGDKGYIEHYQEVK